MPIQAMIAGDAGDAGAKDAMMTGKLVMILATAARAAAATATEAEPLRLAAPAIACKSEGARGETEGFAFPADFGGAKADICVRLAPTGRSDTIDVAVGSKDGPFIVTGQIAIHSRRTTVHLAESTGLGDFTAVPAAKRPAAGATTAGKVLVEISKLGVRIVKLYPRVEHGVITGADLDVAFWAPGVPVEGTFRGQVNGAGAAAGGSGE